MFNNNNLSTFQYAEISVHDELPVKCQNQKTYKLFLIYIYLLKFKYFLHLEFQIKIKKVIIIFID